VPVQKESSPKPTRAASATPLEFPVYDPIEFVADKVVHLVGVGLGAIGAVIVIVLAASHAGALGIVATSLYASSLVATVGFSAAYNLSPPSPTRELLRRLDHATIFFLIAGTHSAMTLVRIDTPWSQWLALFAWSVALAGATLKFVYPRRFERLAVAAYLALGLTVFLALAPLVGMLRPEVVILVVAGSLLYVMGVVFHLWEQLRFQNAIWHALVLSAACCHYLAIVLNM
jgi:hemolysin III